MQSNKIWMLAGITTLAVLFLASVIVIVLHFAYPEEGALGIITGKQVNVVSLDDSCSTVEEANEVVTPVISEDATSRKDDAISLLHTWTQLLNSQDIDAFISLYDDVANYYQSCYTQEKIRASKEKFFIKYPGHHTYVENIVVDITGDEAVIYFDKYVRTTYDGTYTMYPSYLDLIWIGNKWLICGENDKVTDANLARKYNK